jgi:LEA14-like dessication related protein
MPIKWLVTCMAALLLCGCSALYPLRSQPEISLISVEPLSRDGLEQRFLVGLKIVNPSGGALSISGLSFGLWLNERKVITGVSGGLTAIPAYGESRVFIQAGTNMLSSLRAVTDLLREPNSPVDYELRTEIRLGRWPVPVTLSDHGSITLGSLARGG